MNNNDNPLVSVCVTFWNSERFVARIIESCLNQTYKNIEVVMVDDMSTDNAEQVIAKYAAKDARVKYFKTGESLGLTKSLQKTYELAKGKFIIWPGADDWLAPDAIEQGMRSFAEHPDAGAVIPRVVSLREVDKTTFEFVNDVSVPSGTYSSEWIAKNSYRNLQSAVCLFAIFRREDALMAVEYFLKNYCYDPTFPEELQNLTLRKAYAPDFVFFLKIMKKYKYCVSNTSFVLMKISHMTNLDFKDILSNGTASQVLKMEFYRVIFYRTIYKYEYPNFNRGMKIHTRTQSLSEVLVYFIRAGLRPSFFHMKEDKKWITDLLGDLSRFEAATAIVLSIPKTVYRLIVFAGKKFTQLLTRNQDKMAPFLSRKYFLDRESGFKI
jgi:glycosyltransferase involved in cell wall biosynthesis